MFVKNGCGRIRSLSDISDVIAGGDKPKDNSAVQTNEYPYPVYANGVDNEGFQCFAKNYRIDKAAVTISARGTIGATFIRSPFFTPTVRLIAVIPNDEIDVTYLKYAIDKYAIDLIGVSSTGSSQQQLTIPNVNRLQVPVPEITIQRKFANIVKQIDKSKFDQLGRSSSCLMRTILRKK